MRLMARELNCYAIRCGNYYNNAKLCFAIHGGEPPLARLSIAYKRLGVALSLTIVRASNARPYNRAMRILKNGRGYYQSPVV